MQLATRGAEAAHGIEWAAVMKRPSFQFYPGDWRSNAKLRRCSWAARGVWIEVMGLMHDSDDYGILRWPLKDIAQALGANMRELNELVTKGVLYGSEKGECEPMVFRPKHGRREGAPVELVAMQKGPIWYSPRMVRDEYVRMQRGASTRFGEDDDPPPMRGFGDASGGAPKGGFGDASGAQKGPPKAPPSHRQGDGASPSSSSSSSYSVGNSSTSTETEDDASGQARAEEAQAAVIAMATALRALGMRDVHGARPELFQLVAAGATPTQATETAAELAGKKGGQPPNLAYLVATMMGRAADLQLSQGKFDAAGQATGGAAGGRQAPARESAAARAERKRREADARDDDLEQQFG